MLLRLRALTSDHGPIISAATVVTAFGDDLTLAALVVLAASYLACVRLRADALRHLLTAATGATITVSVKLLVARPRPALVAHLVAVQPPSFPSGHATNSAFIYGTLALIAAGRASTNAARTFLATVAIGLVVLIGSSRVVLGVHWPSDVLAGWTIGASWALLAARLSQTVAVPGDVLIAAPPGGDGLLAACMSGSRKNGSQRVTGTATTRLSAC